MRKISADAVILGGGIAGLWTLARLRNAGYNAILIENKAIGGIQSIASQGIIHGGTKYALGGRLGDSAKAIGDMPRIWQTCLDGKGEIDLSAVQVLTQTQLLWSGESALSRVAGFFAGKMMKDRMRSLKPKDFPVPFDHKDFNGSVYQLNEPVVDTQSLVTVMYTQLKAYCFIGEVLGGSDVQRLLVKSDTGEQLQIATQMTVLTAGQGNQGLLELLGRKQPKMQKRPVHMLMVKGDLPELYAHCLGASANPRLTITSTQEADGSVVWYIGGGIAETGIKRDRQQQIEAAKSEINAVLPWLKSSNWLWSTVMLDRCEIHTPGNKRPESSFVESDDGLITVWPTKLAFAPRAAAQVEEAVNRHMGQPRATNLQSDMPLSHPPIASRPWNATQWES